MPGALRGELGISKDSLDDGYRIFFDYHSFELYINTVSELHVCCMHRLAHGTELAAILPSSDPRQRVQLDPAPNLSRECYISDKITRVKHHLL